MEKQVPALDDFRNLSPLVSQLAVRLEQLRLFLLGPRPLVEVGRQMVVPSKFLFSYLSRHCFPERPTSPYCVFMS